MCALTLVVNKELQLPTLYEMAEQDNRFLFATLPVSVTVEVVIAVVAVVSVEADDYSDNDGDIFVDNSCYSLYDD